jgi:hypothetical protein
MCFFTVVLCVVEKCNEGDIVRTHNRSESKHRWSQILKLLIVHVSFIVVLSDINQPCVTTICSYGRPKLISWKCNFRILNNSSSGIGFVTRGTRRVPLVKQELPILPGELKFTHGFGGFRVARSVVLCVVFCWTLHHILIHHRV